MLLMELIWFMGGFIGFIGWPMSGLTIGGYWFPRGELMGIPPFAGIMPNPWYPIAGIIICCCDCWGDDPCCCCCGCGGCEFPGY